MKARNAIDLFIHKDRLAVFWFLFALSVSVGFWWERQRIVRDLSQKPRFIVMDANSTYYLPAAMDFQQAKEIHAVQTKLAMEALYDRGPSGVDNPERLKRILGKDTYRQALKLIEKESAEFQAKQIHQKVEFGAIQVLQVRDDSVLTGVEAQLVRNGVFRNKSFTEVLELQAQFKFILNEDMTHNGRFPTVAVAFEIRPKGVKS